MSVDTASPLEEEDDLDSFYKRKIYDPSESDTSVAWEEQRKDLLNLLQCDPKEGTVFGWCLYEILASIGGTENLLADNEVRQLLFSHIIHLQHLFFYKLERKNLLETRPIAIFLAKSLFQGLFSTSCEHMLDILAYQQLGLFPLMFMHVDANEVFNFMDALIVHQKPPGLMQSIANALCGEIKFHSTRSLQKVQVERLFTLMCCLFEDTKEEQTVWQDIAPMIDPLGEFIVNTMTVQHECEAVCLRLVSLISQYVLVMMLYVDQNHIVRRYSRSVAIVAPNFVKVLSRQTHQLVSILTNDGKHAIQKRNGESKPKRQIQLQVLDLVTSLIKTHDSSILKTMEAYQHVEHICDALFDQLECPIFYNMGVSFIQCVLATRRTNLITPKLIESIVKVFNLKDARRVYIEAVIREVYMIPAYNQHFPSEVVKLMSTSRGRATSVIGMTQAEKLEKKIEALAKQMQTNGVHHTLDTHHQHKNSQYPFPLWDDLKERSINKWMRPY